MTLLEEVPGTYGGRAAWDQAQRITATRFLGARWAMKGHPGALNDLQVTVDWHRENIRREPSLDG